MRPTTVGCKSTGDGGFAWHCLEPNKTLGFKQGMQFDDPHWALVGPGAIGLYYGGLLANSGLRLSILARSDAAALRARGICIRRCGPDRPASGKPLHVLPHAVADTPQTIGAVDAVLITAKATANAPVADALEPLVTPGKTVLLTLQNGIGNAEFFRARFPENPVLAGLCFVCVNRIAPATVENYLPGRVEIGSLGDAFEAEASSAVGRFREAGVKAAFAPALDRALWKKLCWNVPFNGLAIAAGGITTERILGDPELARRARRLMEEIRLIAAKRGHRIEDRFIEGQFEVTTSMGAYRPSSLIDFLAGRAVEVDAIWGQALRIGQGAGVDLPELQKLYREICAAVETGF